MSKKPCFLQAWVKGAIFLFLHACFWILKKQAPIPTSLKRILVCNTASFGDVVISTTILPVLKQQYPNCEIGFLSSVKTSDVLKDHPLVSFHHTIDHWFWNEEHGLVLSLIRYFFDYRRVSKEIKKLHYDLAIDLYPHVFLTSVPLLWSANIPARAGYFVRGFSNLLTAIAQPSSCPEAIGQTHLNLLKSLGVNSASSANPLPSYTHYTARDSKIGRWQGGALNFDPHSDAEAAKLKKFSDAGGSKFSGCPTPPEPTLESQAVYQQPTGHVPKSYLVVHMGTGYKLKEWNTQKWITLIQKLIDQGEKVILTGKGDEEQRRCEEVALKTGCLNACNRLSWGQFASVIQQSKLLISVDSSAVHLASAVCLPCVVLFAGISAMDVWKPPYPLCIALMKKLPCSPCLNRRGCSFMSCIQDIDPEEVLFQVRKLIYRE